MSTRRHCWGVGAPWRRRATHRHDCKDTAASGMAQHSTARHGTARRTWHGKVQQHSAAQHGTAHLGTREVHLPRQLAGVPGQRVRLLNLLAINLRARVGGDGYQGARCCSKINPSVQAARQAAQPWQLAPLTTTGSSVNCCMKLDSRRATRRSANLPCPLMRKVMGSGRLSAAMNASHSCTRAAAAGREVCSVPEEWTETWPAANEHRLPALVGVPCCRGCQHPSRTSGGQMSWPL